MHFRKLLVLAVLLLPAFAFGQLAEFDLVKELKQYPGKPRVIYMTATWCPPCMAKLPLIVDSFGHRDDVSLLILWDRHHYEAPLHAKLAAKFDTARFRFLAQRYYPDRSGFIRISPTRKVMKALRAELNAAYGTRYTDEDIWVGKAVVQQPNGFFVATALDKEKLLAGIRSALAPGP